MESGVHPRVFLLVRHAESSKNVQHTYSSEAGHESLTKYGQRQASTLSRMCHNIVNEHRIERPGLFAPTSRRAIATAAQMGEALGVPVSQIQDLRPLMVSVQGRRIADVHAELPELGAAVALYRAGLLSGEQVPWPGEQIRDLQTRTDKFLAHLQSGTNDLAVIVSHKSTLTSIAITLLRGLGRYPSDFYGYIDFKPGDAVLVRTDAPDHLTILDGRITDMVEHEGETK